MSSTPTSAPEEQTSPAAVYLLRRRDGQRFKIGWAVEPMTRIRRLPEFIADELDLLASHAAWLPSQQRAKQIERSLHRGLATHRATPAHQLDGHTEWFMPQAWRAALRMIRQMPAGGAASLPPALVPFEAAPLPLLQAAAPVADSAVIVSAQDVLWAMEDLLLRASATTRVLVEVAAYRRLIRVVAARGPQARLVDPIRWALLDLETYRWVAGPRSGSFVQLLEYEGNDLLLHLAAPRVVRRWADGALTWQVQALIERVRGLATYSESAASLSRTAGGRP